MPEAVGLKPGRGPARRLRRAAFLDRDGVINVDPGYVYRVADFEFVSGVLPACARMAALGWALVVVTNQAGIGRGFYTESDFAALSDWMRERFAEAGATLAGIYFCPHHPQAGCACRKPQPGMLLAAASELALDLPGSMLFGDKCEDMQAAQAAGLQHRILLGKDGRQRPLENCAAGLASYRFGSLQDAVSSSALAPLLAQATHG
jgi:D-glycero-D-manno-heptose 1,7-bisphosphate phosphatase